MNDPSQTGTGGNDPQERLQESKDRAVDAAQDAAQRVQNVAEDRYDAVKGRIDEAREMAGSKIAEARNLAQDKIAEARDTAEARAEEGVSTAAHGLKDTAHRLRDVAGDLDEKDRWLGATLEQAAKVAERGGDYLSGQNLGDVVNDAQRVARRNPAAFMGGAAALGFALARLGKVTVDRATGPSSRSQYRGRAGYTGGTGAAAAYAPSTHSPADKNRAHAGMSSSAAPTPGGLNTGTTSPVTATQPVTRPTDGRDLHPGQSTPLHRSQT